MSDLIRVGLVGAGSIANIAELPALARTPGIKLAGVVTSDFERSQLCARQWSVERPYESFQEMLDHGRLDVLFVLTPKGRHTAFVEDGLRHGLDVFCEKPLTTRLEEARGLADLARGSRRLLMVGFNRRYAPVYQIARQRFATEKVRFALAQKSRNGSEYRATLENAIHMVDLLRWFCGEAVKVAAHSLAPDPWHEDGTSALIRFDSGAVGSLVAARCAGEWEEGLSLFGDSATVRVSPPDWVEIAEGGATKRIEMRAQANGWAQVNQTLGFGPEVEHFFECVRTRQTPLTNADEAVRTQELTEWILAEAGLPLVDRPAE
ncbi:MAG TPA: Gfo/Idh/MocA family oxidoreductase [Candidatus Dormibacteraeota bacterium]|nr:Gfo/Idh/MocA family oxidoreductase [Candidatus Dormibacteraeota bacterium]